MKYSLLHIIVGDDVMVDVSVHHCVMRETVLMHNESIVGEIFEFPNLRLRTLQIHNAVGK